MDTKKVTPIEISILSSYILKTFILINGINILINLNKSDSIISMILGFIFGFAIVLSYNKSEYDFFKKIDNKFNKTLSLIIKLSLFTCVFAFSSQLLYFSSMFIKSSLLNNVDILPITILFCLTVSYSSSKGINTITKSSFICFFIFLILELVTIIFISPNINSLKVLPLFTSDILTTLKGSIIFSIISVSPLFLLLSIPQKNLESKINKKYIKISYILTNIYLIFNLILVLSVIDKSLAAKIEYPEMFLLSKISVLNFFDRMESILSFKLIFDSFFTLTISIYYIKQCFNSIVRAKIKYANFIIAVVLILISNLFEYSYFMVLNSLSIFLIFNIILLLYFRINVSK